MNTVMGGFNTTVSKTFQRRNDPDVSAKKKRLTGYFWRP